MNKSLWRCISSGGYLYGLPTGDRENMEGTLPDSLRPSLISLCLSVWNMNSSQIASLVADEFRGRWLRAHTGEQRSPLSCPLWGAACLLLGGVHCLSSCLTSYYYLTGDQCHFWKEHGCKNIKKNVIPINHQVLKSNSQLLYVSIVSTIKKSFPRIHTFHYSLKYIVLERN